VAGRPARALPGPSRYRLLIADPGADEAAVVPDRGLVLVGGERPAHRVDEQRVELVAREVLEHELVQVRQALRAEGLVLVALEVGVGWLPVALELLLVRKLAVADLEVGTRTLAGPGRAAADRAKRRPADEGADRPGEVVVEADQRHVGRRVRVVDRVRLRA